MITNKEAESLVEMLSSPDMESQMLAVSMLNQIPFSSEEWRIISNRTNDLNIAKKYELSKETARLTKKLKFLLVNFSSQYDSN